MLRYNPNYRRASFAPCDTPTNHISSGTATSDPVTLSLLVTIAADSDVSLAMALHEAAHATCFVAGSCHVPIAVEATCRVTGPTAPPEHEYR